MHCEITGTEALEPFVSRNGHVFEKAAIEKYLDQNGTCPVTGEPMNFDELIPLKVSRTAPPRTAATASIPQLLQMFQSEWDSTVMETFALKKQLDSVRQELAHALYKHDAACRVIARLMQERDEARAELAAVQAAGGSARPSSGGAEITAELKASMAQLSAQLTAERKTRPTPAPTAQQIAAFKQVASHSVHKASQPGVLSVDISVADPTVVVTGGNDHTAVVFNRQTKKKLATLTGHTKPVTQSIFQGGSGVVLTASSDGTAKVWSPNTQAAALRTVSGHSAPVTALQVHPVSNGSYFMTASEDHTWGFHNVESGTTLAHVRSPKVTSAITSAHLHPDCLLMASGCSDGTVAIWDIRNQSVAAGLGNSGSHAGGVRSIRCSENGFYLVSASANVVNLWDLRTCKPVTQAAMKAEDISALDIAYSGKYVVVAGKKISIYTTADLQLVKELGDHTQQVTDVQWSRDGSFLASVSLDRNLKFFSM